VEEDDCDISAVVEDTDDDVEKLGEAVVEVAKLGEDEEVDELALEEIVKRPEKLISSPSDIWIV